MAVNPFSNLTLETHQVSNWTLLGRLLGLGWKYRLACLRVLVQQFIIVVLAMIQLYLAGLGIDVIKWHATGRLGETPWPGGWNPVVDWSPVAQVSALAGTILLFASVHAVMRYRGTITLSWLSQQRVVYELRTAVYDKLQRLSFRFFDANQSGSIINRVAGDVQAVRMFVDGVVIQVVTLVISLTVYVTYMFRINVGLTLACLATTPLLWIFAILFSKIVRPAYEKNSKLVDQLMLVLSENVQGQSVVKGFGREETEAKKFNEANRAVKDQKASIFHTVAWFQPLMGFLTQVNMVVLLGYGGFLVVRGQMTLGSGMFVFANLLQQFASQVSQVTNIANSIQASLTGAQRVFEILDAPLEVENSHNPRIPTTVRGEVEFRNVSFSYTSNAPIINDISFHVQPGQCVAVVGATGAGKSTLLSLIPRFYDAVKGQVLIDGIDVRDWDLNTLRKQVGLVFQESFLFSNTVAANIAFGHPEATMAQIEEAARIACADEFIRELKDGYDTVIGEYGADLSGGQRQRMSIARALLPQPKFLILDDALAAVDPGTEGEIIKAIEQAMQGRTTFIIAHRLSTLRRADLVIVLRDGKIEQIGTHEQLLKQEGHYRDVAHLQQEAAA